MKRLFPLLAMMSVTIGLMGSTLADSKESVKHLVGVWQQVQKSKTDGHIMLLPVWKVMQSDGTFCTFLIANQSGQSIITNQGRYTMTNDSVVVEHITGSITDPELVGKGNHLTYHFKGKDEVRVSYRISEASREVHENWIRVKLEMPK